MYALVKNHSRKKGNWKKMTQPVVKAKQSLKLNSAGHKKSHIFKLAPCCAHTAKAKLISK